MTSNGTGITGGSGNLAVDPLFVSAGSGDLRLAPSSPCIDAGDPLNSPLSIDTLGFLRMVRRLPARDTDAARARLLHLWAPAGDGLAFLSVRSAFDADYTNLRLVYGFVPSRIKTFQQELRLASATTTPFNWQMGVFYYKAKANVDGFRLTGLAFGGLDRGSITRAEMNTDIPLQRFGIDRVDRKSVV